MGSASVFLGTKRGLLSYLKGFLTVSGVLTVVAVMSALCVCSHQSLLVSRCVNLVNAAQFL